MKIDILTLFPEIVLAPLSESIIQRAREKGLVTIQAHQLRDWAEGSYRRVDDYLYGGGVGMLLKPEPIFRAVEELRTPTTRVILMTPQGTAFKQSVARRLASSPPTGTREAAPHLLILCGHYEGVDHRVITALVDEEISIGDYILTNGALAAAVLIDAVVRLLPGALGDDHSSVEESFSDPSLLEAPAYTKPAEYQGHHVPEILLSGHHRKIAEWRAQQALLRTQQNRPDLLP